MKITSDKRFCHPVQVYLCDELYENLNSLGGCKSDHIRAALLNYLREKRDPIERIDEDLSFHQQKTGELYNLRNRLIEEKERQARVNLENERDLKYKLDELKPTIKRRIEKIGFKELVRDEKAINNFSEYLGISKERFLEIISNANF